MAKLFAKKKKDEAAAEKPALTPAQKKKKRKKIIKRIIIAAVIVLVIAFIAVRSGGKNTVAAVGSYETAQVERRDVVTELTGTATVEPKDKYTITSSVDADILSDSFSENDTVEKDSVMYTLDSSNSSTLDRNIERAQKSYDDAVENLDNLNVKATIAGHITELYVDIGDDVRAGDAIADIVNDTYMYLTVPFSVYDAADFYVGAGAAVTIENNFESVAGTVSEISSNTKTSSSGIKTTDVTIKVRNSGSILSGSAASAQVGNVSCVESGAFKYGTNCSKTVTAEVAGEVTAIVNDDGENVSKNETIVRLKNDDLSDAVDDALSDLNSANDQKDSYIVKAPISGTVVQKNYKSGETITMGTTLAIIYDMSYLKFDLAVDELDIQKISVGQEVSITSDTLSRTISGYVSAISIVGTTTSNSTTYPVTVIIEDPGDLLPGMNVEASIVIEQSKDTLAVPVEAVRRGNKVLVLKDSSKGKTEALTESDFDSVEVTVGISNDYYVEITGGLTEGQTIGCYIQAASNIFDQMNGQGGAMVSVTTESGGAPQGGGGDMPQGGGGGERPQGGGNPGGGM